MNTVNVDIILFHLLYSLVGKHIWISHCSVNEQGHNLSHLFRNQTTLIGLHRFDKLKVACYALLLPLHRKYFLYYIRFVMRFHESVTCVTFECLLKGWGWERGVDRNGGLGSAQCLHCPAAPHWGQAFQSLIFRRTLQIHRSVISGGK